MNKQTKSQYSPQDYDRLLITVYQQLHCLVHSENYEQLINSRHVQGIDFTLSEALDSIDEIRHAFISQQLQQGMRLKSFSTGMKLSSELESLGMQERDNPS